MVIKCQSTFKSMNVFIFSNLGLCTLKLERKVNAILFKKKWWENVLRMWTT